MRPVGAVLGLMLAMVIPGRAADAAAQDDLFELPAGAVELVTSAELYQPFAEQVRAEVERLLAEPAAIDDPATLHLLLAMRVHLALHFHDGRTTVATAAWIRTLQTDPNSRAFAGLTAFAFVEAQRRHPGATEDDPAYRADFERAFDRRLAALPHTPAMVAVLREQRKKIADSTKAALLAQAREKIAPMLAGKTRCGLVEADQLVRVQHRLTTLTAVREEMLRALDRAIAARAEP
jgi:hypothetical protein